VLEWEVFVPERYRVKRFDGEAVPAALMRDLDLVVSGALVNTGPRGIGQLSGRVTDESGAAVPGVTLSLEGSGVERHGVTDPVGEYVIDGVPPGTMRLEAALSGFTSQRRDVIMRAGSSLRVDFTLRVGTLTETVEVTAETPATDANASAPRKSVAASEMQSVPSVNVLNLQRRVAGVLPVHMDIPRAGASYRFVRPLVVDEETSVSLRYTTR